MKASNGALSGGVATDNNNNPLQAAGSFVTTDATPTTPIVSPVAISSTVVALTIPDNAVEVILMPSLADLRISELPGMASYDIVRQNTKESIPVAKVQTLYIKRDATVDVSLLFRFTII